MYNLYAFTIKTDFRNISENREFRQKIEQNCLKGPTLPPFFKKNTAFIEKEKTLIGFLL